MSLRDTLKATVARCTPLEMQPATFQEGHATGIATPVQQTTTIPHGIRVHAATVIATAMQQGSCTGGQGAHSRIASVAPPGALTAQRLAKELIAAAMRRCDEFGDGEAARQEMCRDCLALPPHLQADLLEHFQGKPAGLTLKFQPANTLQIQRQSHHD